MVDCCVACDYPRGCVDIGDCVGGVWDGLGGYLEAAGHGQRSEWVDVSFVRLKMARKER